jgi:hypothetical protein
MKRAKTARKAGNGAGARYAALKAKWEARRLDPDHAGGGDRWVDKPELLLDAAPFIQTLRTLGEITQDRRFEALRAWRYERVNKAEHESLKSIIENWGAP